MYIYIHKCISIQVESHRKAASALRQSVAAIRNNPQRWPSEGGGKGDGAYDDGGSAGAGGAGGSTEAGGGGPHVCGLAGEGGSEEGEFGCDGRVPSLSLSMSDSFSFELAQFPPGTR